MTLFSFNRLFVFAILATFCSKLFGGVNNFFFQGLSTMAGALCNLTNAPLISYIGEHHENNFHVPMLTLNSVCCFCSLVLAAKVYFSLK